MQPLIHVAHVVDAMGGTASFWGKERVIQELMREQRASGAVVPSLIVFNRSRFSDVMAEEGFGVVVLEERHRRLPVRALPSLRAVLRRNPGLVLHTHSFKANVLGRLARAAGVPMGGLVSTCHGWFDETLQETAYNAIDRATSFLTDVATACDPAMARRLRSRRPVEYVRNAVADRAVPSAEERRAARRRFGWRDDEIVAGMLGRLNELKGARNFAEAAALSRGPAVFAVAGRGPLQDEIEARRGERFRYLGYVDPATDFLAAIDVYVQPSTIEGQSMSLLEAMRARLPIVATRAGATEDAVRDGREAVLVPTRDPRALAEAVDALCADAPRRAALAEAARARFERAFLVRVQHERYLAIYRTAAAATTSRRAA